MAKQRWLVRSRTQRVEIEGEYDDYGPITVKRWLRVTHYRRLDAAEASRQIYEIKFGDTWQRVNPMRYSDLRYPFEKIERDLKLTPRTQLGYVNTDGQRPPVTPEWQRRDPGWRAFQERSGVNLLAVH